MWEAVGVAAVEKFWRVPLWVRGEVDTLVVSGVGKVLARANGQRLDTDGILPPLD